MYDQWLQTQTSYEKLIELIKKDSREAQRLITIMKVTELNRVDEIGNTALIHAAFKGLDEVCKLLIPKMSEQAINQINTAGNTTAGNTALTYAAFKGLDEVCKLLIPKMSEQAINQINTAGNTALTYAAFKGLDEVCKLLILKMSEQAINQINTAGNTSLIGAAFKGSDEVCKLLIPKMSEQAINQINSKGNTALTHAAEKGFKVQKLLINIMSNEAINRTLDTLNIEVKESIQKKILYNNKLAENLALFLKMSFLGKDHYNIIEIVKAVKFYEIVNKELLKKHLQKEEINNPESMIEIMNNFIKEHLFTIAGVCKEIQPKTMIAAGELHISNLPTEIINRIVPYIDAPWGLEVETNLLKVCGDNYSAILGLINTYNID